MARLASAFFCLGVLVAATTAFGCGPKTFVRPGGPARPAPEAHEAWAAARAVCGGVGSYVGTFRLTGRLGEQRIRGLASATLEVAIDRRDQLAMEARIAGQLVFRLGGTAGEATLWLRDENRVVRAAAPDLLAALVGANLEPSRLRDMLAGCPAGSNALGRPERYGRVIQAEVNGATVFLVPAGHSWVVRAWSVENWVVGYERVVLGVPERLTISSRPGVVPVVVLALQVTRAERNVDVPASAFVVTIPEGARPMTLAELRAAGPLAERAVP